ncbi:DUF2187 domain-containing protein [Lapidilactobacillus bayanensis]|uniref:DUF2187 domain-containing protein n=1 Tax=Lapidilactobacillus bayanensis TaxID=2485998 RepID=UPI000F7988CD|nr:DUF2187 domain-containing protein [Lapidilactobacillus bayanensis]
MKISDIHVGDTLNCHVKEDMERDFVGIVEKIYENSALLTITESDALDKSNVIELNNKIVVSHSGLSPIAARKSIAQ